MNSDRTFHLFSGRYSIITSFISFLNEDPSPESIFYLWGISGSGKSILLKYLRKEFCKKLKNEWQKIKTLKESELVYKVKSTVSYEKIPSGFVDFGILSVEDYRPTDCFSALLKLREELEANGLEFPLFDYATIIYLYKTKRFFKIKNHINNFFSKEKSFWEEIFKDLDSGKDISIKSLLLRTLSGKNKQRFLKFLQIGKMHGDLLEKLEGLDPELELLDKLPDLFAWDLNYSMLMENAPSRVVLFFDNHEAFWGKEQDLPTSIYNERDEWFRHLVMRLNLSQGIIVVVAGRELPQWSLANRYPILESQITPHKVDYLTEVEADQYLVKAGITESSLRCQLINSSKIDSTVVLPLALSLFTELKIQFGDKMGVQDKISPEMKDKVKELLNWFLRNSKKEIEAALRVLCVCRKFNFEIYSLLGNRIGFNTSSENFQQIISYFFIENIGYSEDVWYKIHDIYREHLLNKADSTVFSVNKVLQEFYINKGQNDVTATAEAIYHLNQWNWEAGIDEWLNIFKDSLRQSNYNLCRALLDVSGSLSIDSSFRRALVSAWKGEYFENLSRYQEAEQEYLNAIKQYQSASIDSPEGLGVYINQGNGFLSLGDVRLKQRKIEQAFDSYSSSIESFEQVINKMPKNVAANNNKGNALQRLAELFFKSNRINEALESWSRSIASYETALSDDPQEKGVLNNKGNAFQKLGDLNISLGHIEEALKNYQQSKSAYEIAIGVEPEFVETYNNLGNVLVSIARLKKNISHFDEALNYYNKSVDYFDLALIKEPNYFESQFNRGEALYGLGDLLQRIDKSNEALAKYEESCDTYTNLIMVAPDYIQAYLRKGNVQLSIALLLIQLKQYTGALKSCNDSLNCYDALLDRSPQDVAAQTNKAYTLQILSRVERFLSNTDEAIKHLKQSMYIYEKILEYDQNSHIALKNKGRVYDSLGDLFVELDNIEDAVGYYKKAIVTFDYALDQIQLDLKIINFKMKSLEKLGDLLETEASHDLAIENYSKSLICVEQIQKRSAINGKIGKYKGELLKKIGKVYEGLSKYKESESYYKQALLEYKKVITMYPNDIEAYYECSQVYCALKKFDKAINELNIVIEANPENENYLNSRAHCYRIFGKYDLALADIDRALKINNEFCNAYGTLAKIDSELGKDNKFYENFEKALSLGCSVRDVIDEDIYNKYKQEEMFVALLTKYQAEF